MRNRMALLRKLLPALGIGSVLAASLVLGPAFVGTLASCAGANLTTSLASPQELGPTITLTGSASCTGGYGYSYGTGGPPIFRFWQFDNVAGRWSMSQDYSSTNTFLWKTVGLPAGDYRLEVDVKSQDEAASVAYDTVKVITFHLGIPCTSAGLAVSPASGTGHT